ncbi:immunoglobulin domain protein [Cooperia oncophora]
MIYYSICSAPPTVVISPDEPEYLLSVGDEQVVVRCLAKGNPTPTIKWSRKDGKMPSDISIRGPHLVISKAKKSHSGEYECTANNAAGSDSATLKIQVNEREDAANHGEFKHDVVFVHVLCCSVPLHFTSLNLAF